MYADELTESMEKAISETNRRRRLQQEYNELHGITPQTIKKSVRDTIKATIDIGENEDIKDVIDKLTSEMLNHAQNLDFEKAAELRDKIKELEGLL